MIMAHHKDMNFDLFITSISSIAPFFTYIAQAGLDHKESPDLLLPKIRQIGLKAEKNMFLRTGGVNTQKGIVFFNWHYLCSSRIFKR